MFSSLESTDFNKVITKKANSIIKKDRMQFSDVYNTVENYCKNNGIIISSIPKIIKEPQDKNFKYELYCEFAFKHATNLSNAIHESAGQWVKMKTIVEHQEFSIEYDMRPLIQIYNLIKLKNVDLHSLILPVKIDDILYMSPEIEIIDVYHKLYSPEHFDDWEDLLEVENKLFKEIYNRISNGVFGGAPSPVDKTDIKYLKYLVLSDFCGEFIKNYVVVGHWAFHAMEASKQQSLQMCSSVEKLQVITSMDINQSIEDLTNFLKKHTNAKISSKKQDLHIPKDFRTSRYTIYVGFLGQDGEIKDKAFMDVFDCGTFELIPYVSISLFTEYTDLEKVKRARDRKISKRRYRNKEKGKRYRSQLWGRSRKRGGEQKEFIIKIGNPFVLLRFLMIDLWVLRMIQEMGHITNDILKTKTKYLIFVIEKIKSKEIGLIEKVFGSDYVGIYKNYIISKKIENMKGRLFYPYYPEREILNKGEYRKI